MVNTERYVEVLTNFWASHGQYESINCEEQWFQQDGAFLHTSNNCLAWLRERF